MASIVVADDDPNARDILSRVLGKGGHEVRLASDGREALELVNASPPDLLLLDLMMPVMSGFEVLSALRVNPQWSQIPVIVITADAGHAPAHLGVDAVLLKPFRIADVRSEVERVLKAKRLFSP